MRLISTGLVAEIAADSKSSAATGHAEDAMRSIQKAISQIAGAAKFQIDSGYDDYDHLA